ncbi:MAG: hypothetical protein ACFFD4_24315 [Candidatus Odinarchaeota archaeon]
MSVQRIKALLSRLRPAKKKIVEPEVRRDATDSDEVDQVSETLHEKWINGKFDSKVVVSVTKKEQYKNIRISLINGREYTTKLGSAMSIQVDPRDIDELIASLQEAKKLVPMPEKKESSGN